MSSLEFHDSGVKGDRIDFKKVEGEATEQHIKVLMDSFYECMLMDAWRGVY